MFYSFYYYNHTELFRLTTTDLISIVSVGGMGFWLHFKWIRPVVNCLHISDWWTFHPFFVCVCVSFVMMSQLDIFGFHTEVNRKRLSSAALHFVDRTLHLWSPMLPISLCFFKRAWAVHFKTQACFEMFAWEGPRWCTSTLRCSVLFKGLL